MEGCAQASNRSSQDGERRGRAMEKEKGGKKWKMEDGDNYETHLRAVRSPEENGGCRPNTPERVGALCPHNASGFLFRW